MNLQGKVVLWEVPDISANDCKRKSQSRSIFDLTFGVIQSGQSGETEERNGQNGKCTNPVVPLPSFQIV